MLSRLQRVIFPAQVANFAPKLTIFEIAPQSPLSYAILNPRTPPKNVERKERMSAMKRRILSVLLVLTMVVGMVPLLPLQVEAAEATSGTCGDNLTWNLDENGTLTISGSGKMKDYVQYNYGHAPWYSQKDSIKNVFISHGVTQIGSYAFDGCSSLTSINIPSSIISIGNRAFWDCVNLNSVYIDSIQDYCCISFYGYTSSPFYNSGDVNLYINNKLTKYLELPSSVTSISNYAFLVVLV